MTIDWAAFTPWQSLFGGALVGLAAVVLLMVNGRIFGISGVLSTTLFGSGERAWRLAVLIGVFVSPWIFMAFGGEIPVKESVSVPLLILAGLLVGFGSSGVFYSLKHPRIKFS